MEKAVAKRLFARAARSAASAPPGLADRVEALLGLRMIEALGLARRAGLAVAGFVKVCEAAKSGKSSLFLAALDGSERGRGKLGALARDLPVAAALTAAELGAAFGRDHVVFAALGPGPLAARLLADARRMAGFRAGAGVSEGRQEPRATEKSSIGST